MDLRKYLPKIRIEIRPEKNLGYDWGRLPFWLKFADSVFRAYIPRYKGEAVHMFLDHETRE